MSSSPFVTLAAAGVFAALAGPALAAPLVIGAVDDGAPAVITGERLPLLAQARDLGALSDHQAIPHAMLVLKRPADRQEAFDRLVHDQLDRSSPRYHQWLRPEQLRQFGPDAADVAAVVSWLQARGLTVNEVAASGMSIDIGGRPSMLGAAFHTTLHTVRLPDGETHIANMTDVAIPAALAPVIRGVTLSDVFPRPAMKRLTRPAGKASATAARNGGISPLFDVGGYLAVAPPDFETIYNENGVFAGTTGAGVLTGAGVTVAAVEQTDIQAADWATFRKAFGLTRYSARLQLTHPGACADPGTTGDEGEAALDTEWISAGAPGATVIEASCASTPLTFGVETALQKLVERGTTASVLSISYGGPEQQSSASFLAGWANLAEEGASEGLSIMVSSGDSGVSYDRNAIAQNGVAVNGLAANAYVTSVGGTDFYDAVQGTTAKYWRNTNTSKFGSALSYVPEIPWDNSCAGAVISTYGNYASAIASCNDPNNPFNFQQGVGGTGGESTVYAKPDFQNIGVPGMPADGMRDQPDVSLFSSNGFWGHFLVLCMSDANEGGTACDYTDTNDVFGNAAGGTSFAAPAFAGITALIVQHGGSAVGNTAPRLYALAKTQFTTMPLTTQCNATLGKKDNAACIFHNVTVGDIAEPCYALAGDCYTTAAASEGIGVLRGPTDQPSKNAYPAGSGYSLATGLGSVNVANLIAKY